MEPKKNMLHPKYNERKQNGMWWIRAHNSTKKKKPALKSLGTPNAKKRKYDKREKEMSIIPPFIYVSNTAPSYTTIQLNSLKRKQTFACGPHPCTNQTC